ncbi:hypothetical protein AMQ83_17120 [Paenibacillus riograndensis]|nr:hypothetical protein AMQ83_17120 [Paenibacillus riograndensis]
MKILIVDDEVVIRKGLIKLLEQISKGITDIDEAKNGEEALTRISVNKPDILITDIQMPIMDGLDLIGKVRTVYPELDVIVLSGYAEFDFVQQALRHQVTDYLLKPITQEQLNEVISKILLKDPARWTSQMDGETIRTMKTTVTLLVKNVMAEDQQETNEIMEDWSTYCRKYGYTWLELKQMMGHFQLLFRSELLLNLKQATGDALPALQQTASSAEELFEVWKNYLASVILYVSERRAPRNKRIVEEVLGRIETQYGDASLNLQGLAESSGLNAPYLSKIFREVMKKPITQYISEYRLEKARELLKYDAPAKINIVAEQCGFSDYPYFSKIFKKNFGISPLEYKEKNG